MSIQIAPSMATSLPIDYDKRLMLFSGRANRRPRRIADKIGVDLGPITLKTFSNGEVYCRYEDNPRRRRLPDPADLRQRRPASTRTTR